MKHIIFLGLFMLSLQLFAQQKQFDKGDDGKFIFYKVVESPQASQQTLISRAKSFFSKNKKLIKVLSETDSSVQANGRLIIDKTVLVVGHPSGELLYSLNFESRNGKYRFWLTDMSFIPYQRDRYGNFVPTKNVGTPLEKEVDKLTAAQWKDIHESAYQKVTKFAETIQKDMATDNAVKPIAKAKSPVSTKTW